MRQRRAEEGGVAPEPPSVSPTGKGLKPCQMADTRWFEPERAWDDEAVMTSLAQARKMALSLPETTEEPHHDLSSWRVKGKIFATVPDDDHIRVMLAEEESRAAVAEHPDFCAEIYWGTRLAGVVVDLGVAPPEIVGELLNDAWCRKAPQKLARASRG
jgi:hypothetical protein